jgi:hypothetical protein
MLFLSKELGQTLETTLEMSTLEFKLWVAYYNLEAKNRREQQRKAKHGRR